MDETKSLAAHHKIAVNHGYRVGTKVGTAGYFSSSGGFVHVYNNPKSKTELHVLTKQGQPQQWVHVNEKGVVHKIGQDHKELLGHFTQFHPEVLDKIRKNRQAKAKQKKQEEQKKKEKNRVMKVKVVKESYQKSFKEYLCSKT